jgi:hypothetical protein
MIKTTNNAQHPAQHLEGLKIQRPEGTIKGYSTETSFGQLRAFVDAARMQINGEYGGNAHLEAEAAIRKAAIREAAIRKAA